MNVLIIEDEIPAAEYLKKSILKYQPKAKIMAVLDSNTSIVQYFAQSPSPDLIFSDIELLDGSVFESLKQVKPQAPIIFTTAYHEYWMEAFETNGISYLLKPFDPAQFAQAMEKYQRLSSFMQNSDLSGILRRLESITPPPPTAYKSRFLVKIGQGIYLLASVDIACIRMKNGLAHAFKGDGKAYVLTGQLSGLMSQLDPKAFFQINRSEIVGLEYIQKIENHFKDRLALQVLGQSETLISSTAKTPALRKWLEA